MRVPDEAAAGPAVLRVSLTSQTGKVAGPDDLPVLLVAPRPRAEPAAAEEAGDG